MSDHNSCESMVIGYRKFCSLTYCKHCQVFQLNIGPMSFRLEREMCDTLCEMMCGVYMEQFKSKSNQQDAIEAADTGKYRSH